jgi:hypothetical protein
MKSLLILILIPFVAEAQTASPKTSGHFEKGGKNKPAASYGGNHTYFVDGVNGSDANAGNGQSNSAWKTIAKVNGYSFANGDSVLLKRGCTWNEQLVIPRGGLHFGNYGSGSKPMLSLATNYGINFNGKDSVTVDGIDENGAGRGFDFENTIGTHVVTVTNCTCYNNPLRGFDFGLYNDLQVTNALLDHDSVFNCAVDEAFWFGNGTEVAQYCYGSGNYVNFRIGIRAVNCKYLHCTAVNVLGECVNIEHEDGWNNPIGSVVSGCWLEGGTSMPAIENRGTNSTFTDNVIIGNNTTYISALREYQPFSGTTIYNNTIVANGSGCAIGVDNEVGTTFKNNIVVGVGGIELLESDNATHDGTWISDYNDWQGTGGFQLGGTHYSTLAAFTAAVGGDSHSITSDPLFTSKYTNLHLQTNSACINAGTSVGLTTDFDGNPTVSIPDIGAYEYQNGLPSPLPPTATAASGVSPGGFTANWNSAGGVTGYRIDVSPSASFNSFVSGFSNLDVGNVTTKVVSGLSAGTKYYYVVRAYNAGGTSGNSNTMTVTTVVTPPPLPPTATAASGVSSGGFTANWNSAGGATGYRIDVSPSASFNSFVSGFSNLDVGNVTTKNVSGLSAGTKYYYVVRAYSAGGTSSNSNTITATTAAPPSLSIPIGSFSASPDTLTKRGFVTLAWTDSNATTATIDNGVGPVSVKSGTISLVVDTSATFSLTLTNSAGSVTYRTSITVVPPPVGTASSPRPVEFLLRQNYPNPFNPGTTIRYELPRASHVTISVYDMLGRAISILVNDTKESGVFEVRFDGSNLASGTYFCIFQAGSFLDTKRLLLLH